MHGLAHTYYEPSEGAAMGNKIFHKPRGCLKEIITASSLRFHSFALGKYFVLEDTFTKSVSGLQSTSLCTQKEQAGNHGQEESHTRDNYWFIGLTCFPSLTQFSYFLRFSSVGGMSQKIFRPCRTWYLKSASSRVSENFAL